MDKIKAQKFLEVDGTNSYMGTEWTMRFYFIVQRMAFNLSSNKQSK